MNRNYAWINDTLVLTAVAVSGLLVLSQTGCNQVSDSVGKSPEIEAAVAASVNGGCCGKCENEIATATATSSECGGNCEDDGAANSTEPSCSECKGEKARTKNSQRTVAGSQDECAGECKACVAGKPENCKCSGEPVAVSVKPPPSEINQEPTKQKRMNSRRQDRDIFHYLLRNHEKIQRTVTELENGVKTVTESDDPAVASKIQAHVASMSLRVERGSPVRMWDELFREIFRNSDKIEMKVAKTKKGVSVTETSDDPYVAKLVKEHAKVVSNFVKRGFDEAHQNHPAPVAPLKK